MKSGMKRLAAVFAAVCALGTTGCGALYAPGISSAFPEPYIPEKRPEAAMRREVEDLFRQHGYEIAGRKAWLPYPHLNVTDVLYDLRKDGTAYNGVAECRADRACKITEIAEKNPLPAR